MLTKGDLVYFGLPDPGTGFDGGFRVLDAERTSTGEPGAFLLCENLIGRDRTHGLCFLDQAKPEGNRYADSDARRWCQRFARERFTPQEQAAMLPTFQSDPPYTKLHRWELLGGKTRVGQCPFVAAEGILDGDRAFLLSVQEADCPDYGFSDEASRIAGFGGRAAAWWLRSPHSEDFPIDVGLVFFNGWLLDFTENRDSVFGVAPACMRPAFNLDLTRVSAMEQLRTAGGAREWVLRLEGEDEEAFREKLGRYPRSVRGTIRRRKEPSGPARFVQLLGLTVFLKIVDLVRAAKGRDPGAE
ncbi:MAG TPA: hypothetical protein IAA56_02585 [Candidatus Galloscillospira excrementavium]|nr:hypothetical protein [Candidatus Galloscillospira excrementavium]